MATRMPSGRRSAAKVTAKVKASAVAQRGCSRKARGGPEGERDGEERRPLGERACGIDGGKGAEDGEPERGVRGAVLEGCRRDEASEIGEKKTGSEIESDLKKNGGSVVLHAEELEAEGEEKRIAGEADEGGKCFAVRKGERVPAAEEKIFGDAAVDEGIAVDLKEMAEEPDAHPGAREEREG